MLPWKQRIAKFAKNSQVSIKILLLLFGSEKGKNMPLVLFWDVKEKACTYKNLLVSDPESRLLLAFHGRWAGLSPYSRLISANVGM